MRRVSSKHFRCFFRARKGEKFPKSTKSGTGYRDLILPTTAFVQAARPQTTKQMATPLRFDMILPNGEPLRWDTPGARWDGTVEEVMAAINQQNNMANNDINSAALTETDVQALNEAFTTILAKLTFAVPLTKDGKKHIYKAGDKSLSFVQLALDTAKTNSTILPANFDATSFDRHVTLFQQLTNFTNQAKQLATELDNTKTVAGGLAMGAGRDVYTYAKAALAKTPGLQSRVDQLAERFKHASTESANHTSPPATS
jgi:hypothetical protein